MKSDTAPALTSAIGFRVTRLALLFRRRLMRALADWEMTPEQWQVLAAVVEHAPGPLSQNVLVDLTLKDRHSISRMVERMVRDGWLSRQPDPDDGRTSLLRATPRATREVGRMRAALMHSFGPVFERMPARRRERFVELVREMTSLFEAEEEP